MSSLSFTNKLSLAAQAVDKYIAQPQVIRWAQKGAIAIGGLGGISILARDVWQAPDGNAKRKVAVRDALILATLPLGFWITHKAMPLHIEPSRSLADMSQYLQGKAQAAANRSGHKSVLDYYRILKGLTLAERKGTKGLLNKAFPAPEAEGFQAHWKELRGFLTAGTIPVLAGMGAGILADRINGDSGKNTLDIVREGLFQTVANVALCTLGTLGGIALADNPIYPIKNRSLRLVVIGAGLVFGLVGGAKVANKLNSSLFPVKDANGNIVAEPRKVEGADALLHVDDASLIGVLAGIGIIKTLLPLFFVASGYRAGAGYKNAPSQLAKALNNSAPVRKTVAEKVTHPGLMFNHEPNFQHRNSSTEWKAIANNAFSAQPAYSQPQHFQFQPSFQQPYLQAPIHSPYVRAY